MQYKAPETTPGIPSSSSKVFQELSVRAQLDPVVIRKMRAYSLRFLSQYELTFDEVRRLVLPGFSWVVENRLAALGFPTSDDAYTVLSQLGLKVIINLTGYLDDAPELQAFHLYHIPIPNQKAPSLAQMHQSVSIIHSSLEADLPVLVHCEAGLGRTGTIIAAYLTTIGYSPQDAIELIRSKRPGSIETEAQEEAIAEFWARSVSS